MPLFGAPQGISAAEQDIRLQQVHDLSMQEETVKLEAAQMGLAQQKKMMEMLSAQEKGPEAAGRTMLERFDYAATVAMQTGNYELADKLGDTAAKIRMNQSTIDVNTQKVKVQDLNIMSNLLNGVTDEKTWNDAQKTFSLETGKPSPYAKLPWSAIQANPQILSKLKQGITTAKEKAEIAKAQASTRSSDASADATRAKMKLIPLQQKYLEARTAALNKAGGKPPTRGDVIMASNMVADKFDLADPVVKAKVEMVSYNISERAQKIMQTTGKSKQEATRQAVQDALENGEYGGLKPRSQKSNAGTRESPILLTKDMKPGKMKANYYYIAPTGKYKGKALLWTGKEFIDPQIPKGRMFADEEGGQGYPDATPGEPNYDDDEVDAEEEEE